MARPEKVAVVEEIRTKLDEADAAVLTEYRGLTVHELADLRASLRPTGTQYKVFKNTLARRAIEGRVSTRSPICSRARWRSRS
jgi:large subunit ribosomal protein L10